MNPICLRYGCFKDVQKTTFERYGCLNGVIKIFLRYRCRNNVLEAFLVRYGCLKDVLKTSFVCYGCLNDDGSKFSLKISSSKPFIKKSLKNF